jgi:hypothetical protein
MRHLLAARFAGGMPPMSTACPTLAQDAPAARAGSGPRGGHSLDEVAHRGGDPRGLVGHRNEAGDCADCARQGGHASVPFPGYSSQISKTMIKISRMAPPLM